MDEFEIDEEQFLSGQEAASFLGVKSQTLYAYASRGLIESLPSKTGRERSYKLSDLIRLRQSARGYKSTRDSEEGVWTGPAIKSAITDIQGDGHRYRGESALDLVRASAPFEAVAELLWQSGAEAKLWSYLQPLPMSKAVKEMLKADLDSLSLLKLVLVDAEINDPVSRKVLRDDRFEIARRLIVSMSTAAALSAGRQPKYFAEKKFKVAASLLSALVQGSSSEQAQVVNSALVLCADHELNASTLSARIAASCDASIYSCLLSALGSFSGSLHGLASRRAEEIVTSSLRFKTAKSWLRDYLQQYEKIPGFGTELYDKGDPRARLLIDTARKVSGRKGNLVRLLEIVECVRDHFNLEPNLDVGLAAVSYALSLPPGSGSLIFAVSRSAGWIAHSIEQREYGGAIRPRARYIGKSG